MFTQVTELFILRHQKRLVFLLHLALFRLVGLSKRKIIKPPLTAFTGFPCGSRVDMFSPESLATLHIRASVSLTVFSIDTRFESYC